MAPKAEPSQKAASVQELLALAHRVRAEAGVRYAELATALRANGALAAAEAFERLAAEERGGAEALAAKLAVKLAAQGGGSPAPAPARLTETFDHEAADDMARSRLVTPYQAFALAVRNQERAFVFWSYVAARSPRRDVKAAAEALAHEGLDRIVPLRRERRRAFHADRQAGGGDPSRTGGPLLAEAGPLERGLAAGLDRLAAGLDGPRADRARALAAETRAMAAELPASPAAAARAPDDLLASAERLVDLYLEAGEQGSDEEALRRAQAFAERAIARVSALRALA